MQRGAVRTHDVHCRIGSSEMTAEKTVRAFAIVSSAGKGSTTGVLLAIQKLASGSTYPAGTVIRVPVLLTLSNPV